MNIYTKEGWLDIAHISEVADRNHINFIIIIGKRQVGKTYGVLKYEVDEDKRFMLTRRVKVELEMLEKNVNSPFEKIYPGQIVFAKESEYTAAISRVHEGEDGETLEQIGIGTALTTIGNIRGFSALINGQLITDWVIDEFIPEEQVFKVRNEGDAFLNAHTTINGNRELEGLPCLRTWLLANSNNLNSEILEALNITKEVERMSLRGEEVRLLKDRGILIILPESKKIIEQRKQKNGLYKAIGGNSKFAKMAYENEFAYNDFSDVRGEPLREYNPYLTIGRITIHLHKNSKRLYVTDKVRARARYELTDSDSGINQFNRQYPDIRTAYLNGRVYFQEMRVKNYFISLLK
ncbi:phage DNA encapsidation protein [Candidatus Saccharibacteria bacterium]|nr:phage DNA encapsidation protein [Candidatus Saccharibacteria bacterium]